MYRFVSASKFDALMNESKCPPPDTRTNQLRSMSSPMRSQTPKFTIDGDSFVTKPNTLTPPIGSRSKPISNLLSTEACKLNLALFSKVPYVHLASTSSIDRVVSEDALSINTDQSDDELFLVLNATDISPYDDIFAVWTLAITVKPPKVDTALLWIPLYSGHPKPEVIDDFEPFVPLYSEHPSIVDVFSSVPWVSSVERFHCSCIEVP